MKPTISLQGRIFSFETPKVMGIVNTTPDSFFAGSRTSDIKSISDRILRMIESGVDILDIGGYSSRPGAEDVSPYEEFERILPALEVARTLAPDIPLSVDTFRASVAEKAIRQFGVEIINDISGGDLDSELFDVVAQNKVAYVLMHSRGNPQTMQSLTDYSDIVADIISEMSFKIAALHQRGVADIIVDPGFGFAKTPEQNFILLNRLADFRMLGCPILVGLSRKSMIWKSLDITPSEALNGTTVLNSVALMHGADILRVHDIKPAKECISLIRKTLTADV